MALPTHLPLPIPIDPRSVFHVLEVTAVFAFALSGLFVARAHRMDAVGTFIATFLAAFGGGTLRDMMLDVRPFYWVKENYLLWGLLFMSILGTFTLRLSSKLFTKNLILVADAVGLGIFSATGTHMALQADWPVLPSVVVGVIAAAFGGLLRDVICAEKPMLVSDPTPYASVAFIGNWFLIWLLERHWFDVFWSTAIVAALIAIARLVLAFAGVRLPQLDDGTSSEGESPPSKAP